MAIGVATIATLLPPLAPFATLAIEIALGAILFVLLSLLFGRRMTWEIVLIIPHVGLKAGLAGMLTQSEKLRERLVKF